MLLHDSARNVALILAFTLGLVACGSSNTSGTDAGPRDAGPSDAGPHDAGDAEQPPGPLPACATTDPLALSQCVDEARYRADLEQIAMPRQPASAHWQVVQDLCATRLTELGFEVERHAYDTGINVIGVREGTSEAARRVIVSAHYDHIPGCVGADDNASGVAGTLEAARVLASIPALPRTLVIACWDEEERGLVGSRAYATRARERGEIIDAHFDLEMIGFVNSEPGSQRMPDGVGLLFPDAEREWRAREQRGDFIAVIGDEPSMTKVAALERYADRIGLPFIPLVVPSGLLNLPQLGDLRRSDHAAFWEQGYPGIMITDTSEFRYAAYHCANGPDVVENLDISFASQVTRMTVAAAAEALGISAP
jgi:hypothetical protein